MSDFKAKMHQIQFWLGLCPRPCYKQMLYSHYSGQPVLVSPSPH